MVNELSGKPFTQGYAKVLGKSPNVYKENARKFGIRWHGSVGRAHRSHHGAQAPVALALIDQAKRDRWFESNCHHHLEALVDQGLPLFLPFGITAEGFTFFRVHFGDVNSSGHHSVHTVVWLSCRKIGEALLVESGKKASPKRCSGDALNLNYFRFSCSSGVRTETWTL